MISEQHHIFIAAPFGCIKVTVTGSNVSQIKPLPNCQLESNTRGSSGLKLQVEKQFKAYFDSGSPFTFPYILTGTDFQQKVWHYLQLIPAGETRTYGNIADSLHSSARAVGGACRYNPLPILIPCHRVVSSSSLGGYCGKTEGPQMEIKRWLLAHESY